MFRKPLRRVLRWFECRVLAVLAVGAGGAAASSVASAQAVEAAEEEVVVLGRWDNPLGYSVSASEGVVGAEELAARPRLRTGEILEVVPGLIVTQHSGTGKSNQMFLRGFNLDHGTDFATWVDGMPVNMPTHGHGQGYTDLNFIIAELVERLEYRKGAYYAEVGDFSSAGAASLTTFRRLDAGRVELGLGEDGYLKALAADSFAAGRGEVLYGVQMHRYDGPWTDISEDLDRNNVLLRYSATGPANGSWDIGLMGYEAEWRAADQVPRRAVDSGLIDRLGSIDTSLGGETQRSSLSGSWQRAFDGGRIEASAYRIAYDLTLFSNFTYFLDDPVDGDQFEQLDDRAITGGSVELTFDGGDEGNSHTVGTTVRVDDIAAVGLFHTADRARVSTVRQDAVEQRSLGVYYSHARRFSERWRATLGIRADRYDFDVTSDLAANSGSADDAIVAPKLNFIYSASDSTELYVSAGRGFHSNDARGTTIAIDPTTGDPAERVSPLVASQEIEAGFRTFAERRLNLSAALWYLELDSELLFIGDAGNTEPSRPSRRYGIEVPLYYRPNDRLTLDVEVALTDSRFTEFDPAGDEIPGSIDRVLAAGAHWQGADGIHGAVRLRYFGPRPLLEDGSVESEASTVMNASFGVRRPRYELRLDVLNLLDSADDDITYWYGSRLAGEPDEGVDDFHSHPMEPRTVRAYASFRF